MPSLRAEEGWYFRAAAFCVAALVLSICSLAAEEPPDPEETTGAETLVEPPAKEKKRAVATSLTQTMDADSGVSVQTLCTNCNNADLSMGGLGNDHVAVTSDGLPVPSGLAQIYLLSVMPPTVIDKVTVKKGASEPQLPGGAVGGGIQIDRRRPQPGMELNFSADTGEYGWTGSRFDVSGEHGRFGGSFVGSWSESNLVDANGDGNPNLPSFERYTVDATAEVRMAPKHRLRVRANRYDESQKDGPAAFDWFSNLFDPTVFKYDLENVELERDQYDALYEGGFSDGSRIHLSLITADRSQDIEETQFSGGVFTDTYFIDDARDHAGLSWSRPFGQQGMMRAGLSYEDATYQVIDVRFNTGPAGLPPGLALVEEVEEWGVWVEGESAIGGEVDLSVGLRFTAFDYVDNEPLVASLSPSPQRLLWLDIPLPDGDRLLPRAALTWKPTDVVTLRFSAGTGFRAPEPIYDEVCCGRRYRNNRGIAIEKSESYGAEVTFQPSPEFRVGGSVFLNDFENRIIRIASLANQYNPTLQNVNIPKARYESLSLDSSWQPAPWVSIKGSVSWLETENRTPNDAIPVLIDFNNDPVMKEFTTSTVPFTTDRRAAVGVTFTPAGTGLSVGINTQYTGPKQIQEFLQDFMTNPDLGFSEVHFDHFVKSPDFWMTSLIASKTFNNGMALFAGVDNVTDYVQTDLGDPTFDDNWGPLRGRYIYGGLSYHLERK